MIFIGGGAGLGPLGSPVHGREGHRQGHLLLRSPYGEGPLLPGQDAETRRLTNFRFVPALSEAGPEDEWDRETGLITGRRRRSLGGED